MREKVRVEPSRKSAVPEGLGISIATFPTVKTVGYLLPSRAAGLECRGFGVNECARTV
jgi:hypothetical protein